jgi:hypothetical protein
VIGHLLQVEDTANAKALRQDKLGSRKAARETMRSE